MLRFPRRARCVRCGSARRVRVVTYVRPPQTDYKLTEPWCRRCRQQRLAYRS